MYLFHGASLPLILVCEATPGSHDSRSTICGGNIRPNDHVTSRQPLRRHLNRIASRTRLLSLQIERTIASCGLPIPFQIDQSCIDDIFIVGTSISLPTPEALFEDLTHDYGDLLDIYSTIKLMQQDTAGRLFSRNIQMIERLVKDILCAMNRSLASFGDMRSRDVLIATSTDSCGAVSFYERSLRNRLLLDRIEQMSIQLCEKYSVYKTIYRGLRKR